MNVASFLQMHTTVLLTTDRGSAASTVESLHHKASVVYTDLILLLELVKNAASVRCRLMAPARKETQKQDGRGGDTESAPFGYRRSKMPSCF